MPFAFANVAVGTDGAVVAAVAGNRIRVRSAVITSATGGVSVVTFTSKPAGAGVAITADIDLAANGNVSLAPSASGWFETAAGEGLSATVATTAVGVTIEYILVRSS